MKFPAFRKCNTPRLQIRSSSFMLISFLNFKPYFLNEKNEQNMYLLNFLNLNP